MEIKRPVSLQWEWDVYLEHQDPFIYGADGKGHDLDELIDAFNAAPDAGDVEALAQSVADESSAWSGNPFTHAVTCALLADRRELVGLLSEAFAVLEVCASRGDDPAVGMMAKKIGEVLGDA